MVTAEKDPWTVCNVYGGYFQHAQDPAFRTVPICHTRIIPAIRGKEYQKKDSLFSGLFLLLFFLLAFDLGEELIECLFPVCSHLCIDLDKVLGDLA